MSQIKISWGPKRSKQPVVFHGFDWCDRDRSNGLLPGTLPGDHMEGLCSQLPQPWSGELPLMLLQLLLQSEIRMLLSNFSITDNQ